MRRRRTRPSADVWEQVMERLMTAHEEHGHMPFHVLVIVGHAFGVAATSAATRYRCHLRALSEAIGFTVSPAQMALVGDAPDFADAFRRMRRRGPLPPFAVVERALWSSHSVALLGLRTRERGHRQAEAERPICAECLVTLERVA